MANDSETPIPDRSPESSTENAQASIEGAKHIIADPDNLLSRARYDPDIIARAGDGFRILREGISDFFVASDRSGGRAKDTADKVIELIREDLARGGLSAEERRQFAQDGAQIAADVRKDEQELRAANARTFVQAVTIAAGAAAGVVVLGYLVKEGKLPPGFASP